MIITTSQTQVEPAKIERRRWNLRRTSSLQLQLNGDLQSVPCLNFSCMYMYCLVNTDTKLQQKIARFENLISGK
ncbi:MAG: hypothetical protein LBH22_01905 [Bacteroidales bacterium]|jgi:hypothetical protein|nr:hypothetical protein [Bacteroidales bacterium]